MDAATHQNGAFILVRSLELHGQTRFLRLPLQMPALQRKDLSFFLLIDSTQKTENIVR